MNHDNVGVVRGTTNYIGEYRGVSTNTHKSDSVCFSLTARLIRITLPSFASGRDHICPTGAHILNYKRHSRD